MIARCLTKFSPCLTSQNKNHSFDRDDAGVGGDVGDGDGGGDDDNDVYDGDGADDDDDDAAGGNVPH